MKLNISNDFQLFKQYCLNILKKNSPELDITFEDLMVFPNISNIWNNFRKNMENFNSEVINNSQLDYLILNREFNLYEKHEYELKKMGDLHDRGKAVSIIFDKASPKVVYKPRSTAALSDFYHIVQNIDNEFSPPKIISKDKYSWVEYVIKSNSDFTTDRQLKSLGIILGIAFCTNTSDLINENFVITSWGPVPIDVEVFCKPRLKLVPGQIESQASVLSIGMLPIVGFEQPGSCIAETMLKPYYKSREEGVDFIIKGFEISYRWCMKYLKSQIPGDINGRILLRFTETYSSYLSSMMFPYSGSIESFKMIYTEKLLRYGKNFPNSDLVIYSEIEQLIQYDIPSFYYNSKDNLLYNDAYKQSLPILDNTSLGCLMEKISQLSEQDLIIQSAKISSSLISKKIKALRFNPNVLKNQSILALNNHFLLSDHGNGSNFMGSSFYHGVQVFCSEKYTASSVVVEPESTVFSRFDSYICKYLEKGESYYPVLADAIEKEINTQGIPKFDNYYSGKAGFLALLCSNKKIFEKEKYLNLAKFLADEL